VAGLSELPEVDFGGYRLTLHLHELNGVACINGEFVAAQDATVSIFDSGFIGGVSVFDTLACWEFEQPVRREMRDAPRGTGCQLVAATRCDPSTPRLGSCVASYEG
jgi:hypothetical protein